MQTTRTLILDNAQIEQKINRIAHEIYENNFKEKELVFVGIETKGYQLAKKLTRVLESISPNKIELVSLKLNKENPLSETFLSTDVHNLKGQTVILVDDVLNSGKTLIYAAKVLLDFPLKKLSTVILVNRRHRQFPIRADYVGLTLSTTIQEHISLEFEKGKDAVYLM